MWPFSSEYRLKKLESLEKKDTNDPDMWVRTKKRRPPEPGGLLITPTKSREGYGIS